MIKPNKMQCTILQRNFHQDSAFVKEQNARKEDHDVRKTSSEKKSHFGCLIQGLEINFFGRLMCLLN